MPRTTGPETEAQLQAPQVFPSEQRFYDELLNIGAGQARMLLALPELERAEVWERDGCYDMIQWVSSKAHISNWAAKRWIRAGWALEEIPYIAGAMVRGWLSLDKVLEMCRFATKENAEDLVAWARTVSTKDVRQRADVAARTELEESRQAIRNRRFGWFLNETSDSYGFYGHLPSDDGAKVIKAIDRMARRITPSPEDDDALDGDNTLEARRADALVALASAHIANDQDPDRATIVIHADLAALRDGNCGAELENGEAIHPETALRLACDCRSQVIAYDGDDSDGCLLGLPHGRFLGVTELIRSAPHWLRRKLIQRDGGCTFPGCEFEAFIQAHHIEHWIRGGPTELDNLILVCSFHHKLVHEFGWGVARDPNGNARWFRPSGARYYGGPIPFEPFEYQPSRPSIFSAANVLLR